MKSGWAGCGGRPTQPGPYAGSRHSKRPPDRPLLLYALNGELLAYHSNRRGEIVRTPEELSAAMERERRGFAVFEKRVFDAWPAAALPLVGAAAEFRSGSRRYVWLEFDLDAPASNRGRLPKPSPPGERLIFP
ncbi:MAG: hypothetical protein AB7V22_10825 [Kiritimatiellia bacterium]